MEKRLTGLFMLLSFVAVGQSRLGIQRYSHVVLPVKNISASIPFYVNALGLKSVVVPASLASSQAWFDLGGGQQIRLVEGRPDGGGNRGAGTYLALSVNSLREAEQQLRQRGLSISRQTGPTGKPVLYVPDPDGYVFELNEGKPDSPGFLKSAAKSIWRSVTEVE